MEMQDQPEARLCTGLCFCLSHMVLFAEQHRDVRPRTPLRLTRGRQGLAQGRGRAASARLRASAAPEWSRPCACPSSPITLNYRAEAQRSPRTCTDAHQKSGHNDHLKRPGDLAAPHQDGGYNGEDVVEQQSSFPAEDEMSVSLGKGFARSLNRCSPSVRPVTAAGFAAASTVCGQG